MTLTLEPPTLPKRRPQSSTARHYAERARRRFLAGLRGVEEPARAIAEGRRLHEEWTAFLEGEEKRFWSENGQAARRKVVRRHPVKKARSRR